MKKLLPLICLIALLYSCSKPTGTLKGSVFWKYNDFVGNKSDAGSKVTLYPSEGGNPIKAVSDMQGNFKIEKIEAGEYLMVVNSENTNNSSIDQFIQLKRANEYLIKYFKFNLDTMEAEKQEKLKKIHLRQKDKIFEGYSEMSYENQLMKTMELDTTIQFSAMRLLYQLPDTICKALGNPQHHAKILIKAVTIEPEKETMEVVDFGTTYN